MLTAHLFGLGDPTPAEADQIAALLAAGTPTSETIRDFLLMVPTSRWQETVAKLLVKGVSPETVATGFQLAQQQGRLPWKTITAAMTLVSATASAFHGVRRNKSVAWGLWWFTMGALFPIITPTIALAQGFGRAKEK